MSAESLQVPLHEIDRGTVKRRFAPDAAERAAIARELKIEGLPSFTAELTLKPWFDGAHITGRFSAVVEQICSVSLESFEQPLKGEIDLRVVPAGSPHVPDSDGGEVEYDPEAPDPPDVLEGSVIDVAAYAIEHLALELDPFPRKPGAEFDYQPPEAEMSPFAVLKALKDPKS